MNPRVRNRLFAALALTVPLVACARDPQPAAPPPAPAAAQTVPAAPLVTGLPDFTRLVEQVAPGVVNIEARTSPRVASRGGMPDEQQIPEIFRRFFGPGFGMPGPAPEAMPGRSLGSGFLIGDGYVLTNHHVVDGADTITVRLDDRREFSAELVGSDEAYDVALLKVEAKNLPSLRLGDSAALKQGQWVVAIGSPLGLEQSVTAGIVSALGRSGGRGQQYVPFIQTDVAINRGNSGGPLLNTAGEVVGINSQILSNSGGYMGVSFAIPIDLAMSAVEQIKKTGKVSRGMLGVTIEPVDANKAKALGLDSSRGALVNNVEAGSAAAKGGVEIGDVIVSINGQPVNSHADLPPMVGMLPPGTKARVGVIRDGKQRELGVTLGELTSDMQRLAASPGAERGTGPAAAAPATLIGLRVADLDAAARRQLGLDAGEGVRIVGVESAEAREAGLRPGMVILRVGRTPVASVAELERQVRGFRSGEVAMLLVRNPSGATSFVALAIGAGD
ncbi:peptidase S1 [Pseudoxanthomonas broegbernensis]|uniref:Probable periplasmic serine endoprotease DegP-like n=1 Tax=Pseudoxanthomonas broegbernensis TaxID=83619 RepID=A0A7V8K7T6_9GAMM|nr:DegQ family serine endoprotease [Pseudoxanthomonas broegbernensis]KAF1687528.1 peptidase S1 [Pseudoxanthomonas broegbernensis]MBB6064536.1 serine protease Do [Pseudoxanthomonas broegbernensis]